MCLLAQSDCDIGASYVIAKHDMSAGVPRPAGLLQVHTLPSVTQHRHLRPSARARVTSICVHPPVWCNDCVQVPSLELAWNDVPNVGESPEDDVFEQSLPPSSPDVLERYHMVSPEEGTTMSDPPPRLSSPIIDIAEQDADGDGTFMLDAPREHSTPHPGAEEDDNHDLPSDVTGDFRVDVEPIVFAGDLARVQNRIEESRKTLQDSFQVARQQWSVLRRQQLGEVRRRCVEHALPG